MDRYPVTEPLTHGVLRRIDRAANNKLIDALCFGVAGGIYGGALWVVAQWLFGA